MDKSKYRNFNAKTALAWGKEHYSDWLVEMQNQDNQPQTPTEKFFRHYTQGKHYTFNQVLRGGYDIEEYCKDSTLSADMFHNAISEIETHPVSENIVVYRYLCKNTVRSMLKWSKLSFFKKESIIYDKAFLSTTLTPETVQSRNYAHGYRKMLEIYVPKGTPCLYLELIADMGQENEVLFAPNTRLKILSSSIFTKTVECVIESTLERHKEIY